MRPRFHSSQDAAPEREWNLNYFVFQGFLQERVSDGNYLAPIRVT